MASTIDIDGNGLSVEDLIQIGYYKAQVRITDEAWAAVKEGRKVIDDIVSSGKIVYGVNTGFGNFADVIIANDKLEQLQENLIRSHSAGIGQPLTPERARMLMALRINVLAKGHSGVSPTTLEQYVTVLNKNCVPWVPEKGTVGASGDLAPLAHLALGMLGEGKMWSDQHNKYMHAAEVLKEHGLSTLKLKAKEGLALINGTQLITALGAEAVFRASNAAKTADIVAALTLEALKGTVKAFLPEIHRVRPHPGQNLVAKRMRTLLHSDKYPSLISLDHHDCGKVQDSYTLRCTPQVHGVTHDTVQFVHGIISTEMNSATDNPMIFTNPSRTLSGGNFHGEYPAKAMDYLAIGIHEIANISERRIERLVNYHLSGLPPFLSKEGGFNSGFMMVHVTAAALVSENKTLCHPASVDSISTSAAKEDHVSMGGWAARKALQVVENVESVVAIELLAACQAIDFLRPLTTTEPLEKVYALVREVVPFMERDRFVAPDMEAVTELVKSGKVYNVVRPYLEAGDAL
jgi:histidine ammonia-lyase